MPSLHPDRDEKLRELARGGCLTGALLMGLAMCGVLLWFAVLRENLVFWRNAGGYPLELRQMVLFSFYPLGATTTAGLALIGWALFRRGGSSPRLWLCHAVLLVICVVMLAGAAAVAFTNNIQNLWNGAPLHHHEEEGTP